MESVYYLIFFLVSFGASVIGAVCGIGGGVLIKPLLDAFGILSVASISFLSGCTVLSMSCYSVGKSIRSKESLVDLRIGTPLAIGAAAGGVAGKIMFRYLTSIFQNKDQVGAVQAGCLLVITFGTMFYTLKKGRIRTKHVKNAMTCILIGLILGFFSSFLGIGGGPINLMILFYFYSMDTKTAVQNSLYIILFSQITSLFNTLFTHTVPEFHVILLILMVGGGLLGGIVGRKINKRIDSNTVNKLFIGIMAAIMLICIYNVFQFI